MILASRRQTLRLLAGLVFASATALPVAAQRIKATEAQLKVAYLYNLALFTTWPPGTFANEKAPFVIAALGEHAFGNEFESFLTKGKVNGRAIKPIIINKGGVIPDCQILYIAPSERDRIEQILATVKGKRVLTVADAEPFCRIGGCVRLERIGSKVGVVINPEAVKGQMLSVTADLLSIARIVPTQK